MIRADPSHAVPTVTTNYKILLQEDFCPLPGIAKVLDRIPQIFLPILSLAQDVCKEGAGPAAL